MFYICIIFLKNTFLFAPFFTYKIWRYFCFDKQKKGLKHLKFCLITIVINFFKLPPNLFFIIQITFDKGK